MARQENDNQEGEMTFLDHLETLRWHLIRSFLVILGLAIIAFLNKSIVFDGIVLAPSSTDFWTYRTLCILSDKLYLGDNLCIKSMGFELSNIHMAGQFTQHIFVSLAMGIIAGFPYLVFELWRFIKPALNKAETKYALALIFFTSLLFFLGVAFGYYLLSPMSIRFLGTYQVSESITNVITIRSYIATLASVTFAAAIIFEIPILVYFLSKMGLVTPDVMRQYRKHAFVSVLAIAAVLTPPDMTSQILLCIPFFLLYEGSIKICRMVTKSTE